MDNQGILQSSTNIGGKTRFVYFLRNEIDKKISFFNGKNLGLDFPKAISVQGNDKIQIEG